MTRSTEPCPGCGHAAGRRACQELFDDVALRVRALAWTDSLKTWRLMHDVYDIQHPEDFCADYPALVMHLGGVCWGLEHGGHEHGYRALQQLVERDRQADEGPSLLPGIPAARGAITVASLASLAEPPHLISGVDRWARSVWLAYAGLQPLARQWIQQALPLVSQRPR